MKTKISEDAYRVWVTDMLIFSSWLGGWPHNVSALGRQFSSCKWCTMCCHQIVISYCINVVIVLCIPFLFSAFYVLAYDRIALNYTTTLCSTPQVKRRICYFIIVLQQRIYFWRFKLSCSRLFCLHIMMRQLWHGDCCQVVKTKNSKNFIQLSLVRTHF